MLYTRFGEGMGLLEQRFGAGIKIEWVGVGPDLWAAPPPGLQPGLSPLEWLPPWGLA